MPLSPAYGGSSPKGGASYFSLSRRERWHAVGVTERVFRWGANTPINPNLKPSIQNIPSTILFYHKTPRLSTDMLTKKGENDTMRIRKNPRKGGVLP